MFLSLVLIIIGVVFLLQNLGYISEDAWSIIWPAILIVIGLGLILKRKDHGFFWEERFGLAPTPKFGVGVKRKKRD